MASASFGSSRSRAQELAQIHAVHEFHEQKIEPAGLAEVVNRDNVRVVQRRERLRLAGKAFGEFRVAHALRREEFQCHETVRAIFCRAL